MFFLVVVLFLFLFLFCFVVVVGVFLGGEFVVVCILCCGVCFICCCYFLACFVFWGDLGGILGLFIVVVFVRILRINLLHVFIVL